MKILSARWRLIIVAGLSVALVAACATPTPAPVPTEPPPSETPPPTHTNTPEPTSTPTDSPEPTSTPTAAPTDTPTSTSTPSRTPTPRATNTPRATATPTQPPVPPLLSAARDMLNRVHALGGSMDRIYAGSGAEACAPFLADFYAIVNAATHDVNQQPSQVQSAYSLYREAVAIITDKVNSIREVCEAGGGTIGNLAFDVARIGVNEAGDRLNAAIGLLQNP
ncbi:MAG TPA: hypothetical protein VFL17_08585 [Anaerolineae bacterium]|nr:hypothetical protein [Anaerolineae bacterium]